LPDPLLNVRGLTVSYGLAPAVSGIDLTVEAGEVVALLGANGAGKSSTLLALSGVIRRGGSVSFDGEDLAGLEPYEIVRRGLVQVPERRAIFPDMTVAENLAVGAYARKAGSALDADRALVRDTFPRLDELATRRAGSLSGGEQQMLVLAKALLAGPRLLLVDELSLGLAPIVVQELFNVITSIRDKGVAILLVEQFVPLALRLADRVYVLEKGAVVAEGPAQMFRDDPSILRSAYLGRAVKEQPVARARPRR
jgi:branched-chain amino acid transport system ATP-binding protein